MKWKTALLVLSGFAAGLVLASGEVEAHDPSECACPTPPPCPEPPPCIPCREEPAMIAAPAPDREAVEHALELIEKAEEQAEEQVTAGEEL